MRDHPHFLFNSYLVEIYYLSKKTSNEVPTYITDSRFLFHGFM